MTSTPAAHWSARLENWARWADDALGTGYSASALSGGVAARAAPYERDALAVEALLVRLKLRRAPLYRAVWQRYVMRRDDMTASEALKCSPREYLARLDAAYRALELFAREGRG